MCGIIGYIGRAEAVPVLIDGLRRLEYRGYDSAGLAVRGDDGIQVRKCVGRIDNLASLIAADPPRGGCGISHTRWATHGGVTDANAHPHTDRSGRLVLVHNGVIENYQSLRDQLRAEGNVFLSETDTEVLAHLVGREYDRHGGDPSKARLLEALRAALRAVKGTYGIALMHADLPGLIVGARRGSPLVVGIGREENFLASDVSAIVAHTRDAIYLNDHEIAALEADAFEISTLAGGEAAHAVMRVDYAEEDASKGDYPHFMLKEIFEQPDTVRDAMRGRLSHEEATAKLGGLNMTPAELRGVDRLVIAGCGTALHAAMVGEYQIEALAHLPVEIEFASEFRYRNLPLDKSTLVFVVSQSGETADTLAALRESRRKGHRTLGICNNVASTIARESDGGVYMHAGPEIGVAATKTFTSQVVILGLLALAFGRMRHLSTAEGIRIIEAFEALPDQVRQTLQLADHIRTVAARYAGAEGMLFMGRQFQFPVALEGALKMKEISYLHAQGHPSAELKHGVIALIGPDLPSVFIAPDDAVFEKNVSNIEEVRARRGPVIAIGTEGGPDLSKVADDVILVPRTLDFLMPVLTAIPLQLLSYYTAVQLGCDVDKPRNLAKSVTVE
jgi:glucosamine--fructose-6-phosphate aminotransferase (isomerizing)